MLAPLASECVEAKYVSGAPPQRRQSVREAYASVASLVLSLVTEVHTQALAPDAEAQVRMAPFFRVVETDPFVCTALVHVSLVVPWWILVILRLCHALTGNVRISAEDSRHFAPIRTRTLHTVPAAVCGDPLDVHDGDRVVGGARGGQCRCGPVHRGTHNTGPRAGRGHGPAGVPRSCLRSECM